jgi:hypothetical protein
MTFDWFSILVAALVAIPFLTLTDMIIDAIKNRKE